MQHATRAARDAARVQKAALNVATTNQAQQARCQAALLMLCCTFTDSRRSSSTRRVSDPDLTTRLQLDAEQLSMPLLHTCTAEQVGYAHVKVRDRAVDGCGLQACRKLGSETFRYLFSDLRHLGLQTISFRSYCSWRAKMI